MIRSSTTTALTTLSAALIFNIAPVAAESSKWQRINAPQQTTVNINGAVREIHPGCAFPGDDYSFYFKQGKLDKLAIFFNGGGACWNSTTCLASLAPQISQPAYVPSDDLPYNNPQLVDGLMNSSNPDNPYKDWSIVYLPYCTGDVHFGSKDMSYPTPYGTQIIRHRGFDNFLYAREWTKQYFINKGESPDKVLVTGSSAGGYGAALNYPHIKAIFPNAKGSLLADGSSGVLTENLMQDAIRGPNSAWNFDANIAQSVPGMTTLTALSANSFTPAVYSTLANHYPKDRFAQYTTVHDLIQTMFYNIMLNPDDLSQWGNLTGPLFATWTGGMLTNSYLQAASFNYRFYVAPGCQHTILRSNAMYSNQTVGGTTFLNWFDGLSNSKNKQNWNNLSCTDVGCQYQPLTPAQIGACAITP